MRRGWWLGLVGLCTWVLAAGEYRTKVWTSEDGLPQNTVNALVQTHDGYLWFSTHFGIVRFDGVEFSVFTRANTPGLDDDACLKMVEDADGTLWVMTPGGLIGRRDGVFRSYRLAEVASPNHHWGIAPRQGGGLWLITDATLSRVDAGRSRVVARQDAWANHRALCLLEEPGGGLLLGTSGGIFRQAISGSGWNPMAVGLGESEPTVVCMAHGADGDLWVGSFDSGVYRLHKGQWYHYGTADGAPELRVASILADRHGDVWVLGNNGRLTRFRDGAFRVLGRADGLSDDAVMGMVEDREGNLWIGTRFGGLNRVQRSRVAAYSKADGLLDNNCWTIAEGRDGSLWVGSDRGVSRWRDGHFSTFVSPGVAGQDKAKTILEDRSGKLWVGLTQSGLSALGDGGLRPFWPQALADLNYLSVLCEDREGRLWGGTRAGLWCRQGAAVRHWSTADGLAHDDVRAIHESRRGDLWLGTYGGGVCCLRDGRFRTWRVADGLADNLAWLIHEDPDGLIWVGTENGLSRLAADGRVAAFRREQGLFDNVVNSLLEDDRGYFWIGCNRGIYRVRRQQLNELAEGRIARVDCVVYGAADGLLSTETNGENQPAACRTRDGRLWFVTTQGVVAIDPREAGENPLPPPVLIEAVHFDREPIRWAEAQVALGPGRGQVVQIEYTATSLSAPELVRFRYRLEGWDRDWIEAQNHRTAYYTRLTPGAYRFHVIACNNHGVWNYQGAGFSFVLAPQLHQRTGFWVAVAAGGVLLVWGFHRRRLHVAQTIHDLRHRHALEQERTRIARAMHDDLGASVTHVAMLSELARRRLDTPADAERQLRRIGATSQAMHRALDEIVWTVNPKHDSMDGLVSFLAQYAPGFLEAGGVRCRLDLPEASPAIVLSAEQRHELFLAVKEALNNVVRHARATEVWLRVTVDGGALAVEIADDGIGFDVAAAARRGNGFDNMRSRVHRLHGRIAWESQPGAGTRVRIDVPLPGPG